MFQHFYAVYEIKLDNDNLIHFLLFFNEKKITEMFTCFYFFTLYKQHYNNYFDSDTLNFKIAWTMQWKKCLKKIHKPILGLEWETKNIKSINVQC